MDEKNIRSRSVLPVGDSRGQNPVDAYKIYKKLRNKEQLLDTRLCIELAAAAYRKNGMSHVKSNETYNAYVDRHHSQVITNPRTGLVEAAGKVKNHLANRDHMVYALFDILQGTDKSKYIKKKDVELADEMVNHFQGLLFKHIAGTLSEFDEKVYKLISTKTMDITELGLVAALPKTYFSNVTWNKQAAYERKLSETSEYAGTVGKRCSFNLSVISKRYLSKHDSYIITTKDEHENIVKFFAGHHTLTLPEVGDKITITAYVKSHEVGKFNGAKETIINRIKFISGDDFF
jgi:hypothetical protein